MGKYFEEFRVGDQYVTPERCISADDIRVFADLTGDHNPIHVDPEFAARSIFGTCISHGPMMVGITFGLLSRLDLLDGTIIALKAIEWSFNAPIKAGDCVHVRATVKAARASRKAADRGAVTFVIEIINQEGAVVQIGSATGIMARRFV
ncbi:MAG: MaoC family dehydratase N-terminal domain-containing protein [Alphaproteobacteria bacterium]|nr:MaoC family dehydratase N-terminal domain-containing protein [Alphaproteobacteria bacterium]